MNKTKELIKAMLTENTGRAMMDSGDYYGRHWQKNVGKDFEAMPSTDVEFSTWGGPDRAPELEVMVTHNVYHWLLDKLDRTDAAEELQKLYDAYVEGEDENKYDLQLMEDFTQEQLEELVGEKPTGIYGEGEPMTVNSYNGEDLLSQTIQYTYFELREGTFEGCFVLLQIHGGCDARGGYTKPKVFEVKEELGIMDNARATVYCEKDDEHRWTTDDACNWSPECKFDGAWDRTNLEDRDVVVLKEGESAGDVFKKGVVVVDKEKRAGHCPHCCGVLNASSY